MKKILKFTGWFSGIVFVLLNIIVALHAYSLTHFYNKNTSDTVQPGKLSKILFGNKFFKNKKIIDTPNFFHTSFKIQTEDNLNLDVYENVAATDSSGLAKYGNKGTVILFHGFGVNKTYLTKEAEVFYKLGYHILLIDFRAHGNSEGTSSTIGIEEAKDVKAAYDYVIKEGEKNIILYGVSLGAASITKAMYDFQLKPAKVILDMPYGDLYDAIKGYLRIWHMPEQPLAPALMFWSSVEHGHWTYDMKPSEYAKAINCPVLLEWGMKDPRVTEAETEAIFKNLDSRNKLMIKYAQSGHESLLNKEPEKWKNVISNFLQ